ncbi:hypothetical protein TRFO_04047 [Tritrichomonas foetus]|uniref:Uncharacterized protein n=1 Tax=Tritrichomonas foetus TaxID=1144522 RepID=A0A1J4KIP0_9EUKA|nr:hypothetical protein TRFO_04047 [Tritrichomonas foetus]|eukprot:OHT11099.1 hypothetical protein TRFO_04047 [Tritrichomonas foetus]
MYGSRFQSKNSRNRKKLRVARFITNKFTYFGQNDFIQPHIPTRSTRHSNDSHRSSKYIYDESISSKKSNKDQDKISDKLSYQEFIVESSANENCQDEDSVSNVSRSDQADKIQVTLNDTNLTHFQVKSIEPLNFESQNRPSLQCMFQHIPKSFDIVRRGNLPAIIFTGERVELVW